MFWWWILFLIGVYVAILGAFNLFAWKQGLNPEELKTNSIGLALVIAFRWLFGVSMFLSGVYTVLFSILKP